LIAEGTVTIADYVNLHPWWTLIYLVIICAASNAVAARRGRVKVSVTDGVAEVIKKIAK
jgi:hypothetical protein